MKEVRQDLFDSEDDQEPSGSDQNLCKKKWGECLDFIEKEIPWQTFKTWFFPIIPVSFVEETLVLRVPSRFVFEWLESHFSDTLDSNIKRVFGENARVEYLVAPSSRDKHDKADPEIRREDDSDKAEAEKPAPSLADSVLNPLFAFDNFFVYRKNSMVKKAAEYVASHLDNSRFNPLFYYGNTGSGKTHLLNAIGNTFSRHHPGKKITLLNGGQFLHEYVYALQNGLINDFKGMLINSDVFLLDDVHYLSNRMKSQENLAYVISQLLGKNKRIVITCNAPPSRLMKFSERLVSIFQSGLIVDLVIPERTTREKIIEHRLKEAGVQLSEELVEYLGEKFDSNMHSLNAALVRISAQISLLGSSINLDECRSITSHLRSESQDSKAKMADLSRITVDKVIRNVGRFFEVPPDLISGNSRLAKIVMARQIAMYISRKYTGDSFASIGYHFGDRSHATVLYACKKIQRELKDSPELQNAVERIVAAIFGLA